MGHYNFETIKQYQQIMGEPMDTTAAGADMIDCSLAVNDSGENSIPIQNDLEDIIDTTPTPLGKRRSPVQSDTENIIDTSPKPLSKRRSPVQSDTEDIIDTSPTPLGKRRSPVQSDILLIKRKKLFNSNPIVRESNHRKNRYEKLNVGVVRPYSSENKENSINQLNKSEDKFADRVNENYNKCPTLLATRKLNSPHLIEPQTFLPRCDRFPRDCKKKTNYASLEMSHDQFNYQTSDGGGVHRTGRNIHASDHYSNNDNRQQLQDIATSMASLCNIGNSCYMNSVIYTLRFAPFFLHNLHHLVDDISQINNRKEMQTKVKSSSLGRNVSGLQGQNARSWSSKDLASLGSAGGQPIEIPKTVQQIATEKLHDLFTNLHRNETMDTLEPYQSDNFLKSIQDVNPIFEGNQQQDAHEFLMCILDSIRETCQSLTKVIMDHPEVIMNGFVSIAEHIESPPAPATLTQSQTTEKKTTWFRKSKSKDEKHKIPKSESPSKETENMEIGVAVNTPTDNITDSKLSLNDKEKIQEQIKKLGLDFFNEDFEGVTMSSTRCLSCEAVTEQKESMIDLSVPITENMDTAEHSNFFIQNLMTREQFRGDNKYRCEGCMGYTEAIRTITYPVLPRLLIIQLKRFSGGMEKINSHIHTPFTLQCFCSQCCELSADVEKPHEYRLYSVITHVGATMCAGHYIAYTCSLDLNSTYINCPKDLKRKEAATAAKAAATKQKETINSTNNSSSSSSNSSNSVTGAIEKNVTNLKKMVFRRNKASSSTDVTKSFKLNGVKNLTNGVDKLSLASNSTASTIGTSCCPAGSCCSISMNLCKPIAQYSNGVAGGNGGGAGSSATGGNGVSNSGPVTNGIDYREHSRSSSLSSGYGDQFYSTASGASSIGSAGTRKPEPLWYMCDDDKIKAMTQHDFRDMLQPNKKNMITPYLLFYARNDVQGSP